MNKSSFHLIIIFISVIVLVTQAGCKKEEFGGLGIEVPSGEEKVTAENPYIIKMVYEGGSGDRAGLQANDKIISVDGNPLIGMQHDYIVKNLLRGKPGTPIILEVERNGENLIFRVNRGKIILKK